MKKLILTICLMILGTGFLSAQEDNTIYIIFTSTESDVSGVWHQKHKNNPEYYRYGPHDFTILNRSKGYFFRFSYVNRKNKPDNPIISKPVDFLETIEYIDWDVIGPTLTKEQAEEKYQEIIFYPKIFFIDRNDVQDGVMKMVPVKVFKDVFS